MRTILRLIFRLSAIGIFLAAATSFAAAQETPRIRTDLFPKIYELLDANAALQSRWRQCPADLFGKEKAFWDSAFGHRDIEMEECDADPLGCHSSCFEARNPDACFALARTLQENAGEDKARHYEAMFAQACATGSAGGCTNRASGIKNGYYPDEPFDTVATDVRAMCIFRSFELSCGQGDAWGCTMHGMSYEYGEGVQANIALAREFYEMSCAINPDFDACDYARAQLGGPE